MADSQEIVEQVRRFTVKRQLMRMFWHFGCNLASVMAKERPA